MAVDWIGDENSDTFVAESSDATTGTYAWGLHFDSVQLNFPFGAKKLIAEYGESRARLLYKLGHFAEIREPIDNATDYNKLMQAIHYWNATPTKLYLVVKNTWGINLAVYAEFATPTVLTGWTGFLEGLKVPVQATTCVIPFKFQFSKDVY